MSVTHLPFSPIEALAEERAAVEDKLQAVYAGFVPTDGIGFGKRVGDGTHIAVERITDVGKQEVLLSKLAQIERAQEKVAEGTYGLCDVCHEHIAEERLELRPYATRCVRDA